MKTAVMLGLALITALLGGWMLAKYDLTDRVSKVAIDAKGLCRAPRGSAPVTEELIEERLIEIANAQRLYASDIAIETREVDDASGMAGQVAGSLSKLTKGKLKMEATEVEVRLRLEGKKWLWSVDREISSTCMVRGGVQRVGG